MRDLRHGNWRLRLLVVAIAVSAGCASTNQAQRVSTSGFLQNYNQLKPGGPGQAQLLYIDASADFSQYDSILMDPVTAYATAHGSQLSSVPLDEMVALLNYLDAAVRGQLQDHYTFVTEPGPRTMRLRIALTEAKGARVVLSAASSVTPAGLALNGLKKVVTGASTGVGSTGVEMELLDSMSGRRLAAAVDERVGTKTSSFGKWDSAKEACDFWAAKLKARLAEFRAK